MQRLHGLVVAGAVLAVLAACSAAAAPGTASPSGSADTTISSGSLSFDSETLTVPAGRAFTLQYINRSALPHNVAIYDDSSLAEKIFVGETIGEGSVVYEVPAIPAGEYFFRCDIHPEMTGSLISR